MGELDLKSHFLRKLNELRDMKEEYYQLPPPPDPVELLAQRATLIKTTVDRRVGGNIDDGAPWTAEESQG